MQVKSMNKGAWQNSKMKDAIDEKNASIYLLQIKIRERYCIKELQKVQTNIKEQLRLKEADKVQNFILSF